MTIIQQNSGSFLNEPSETTSKASSFDFTDFYKYGQAEHVPPISEKFLEWFIGFFEGDGSLWSYATLDKRDGREGARFQLNISQKEKSIIEKIQKVFGFGTINSFNQNGKIYWRWKVDSKKAV